VPRDQAMLPGRRRLLQSMGALSVSLAGGSLLAGCANQVAPFFAGSTGSRPETTTIRFPERFVTCVTPERIAADLLQSDGFDVKFVPVDIDVERAVSAGDLDLAMQTASSTTIHADTASSFVHLAGIHVGCFELFASAGIQSVSGLQGKRVAVNSLGSGPHVHMAMMAAYIGLDPNRDFTWVTGGSAEAMEAFATGQVDGFMGFAPEPQLLRRRGLGNVLVNTRSDRPWSQHFCCGLIANRAFVQNNPVATKQALRAILKAADLCAQDPTGVAQRLIDRGVASDYGSALQTLSHDVSYDRWREYDPEDTIRFYGLLLHQIGMVKSTPDKIIAQSTDWRFLNELKKELKT
jgi:NitT/TauT family transport system substrate-binding protein